MRHVDRDPSNLVRPDGNTLVDNYDAHDIGEAHVTRHFEHMGMCVESWGIDKRDNDESLIFDDAMDLRLYEHAVGDNIDPDEHDPDALLEVKTKRSEDWFGIINRRHFRKYLRHRHRTDVPTLIYMSLVDDERDVVTRDTFIPIQLWEDLERVLAGEYDYYPPESAEQFLVEQVDDHPQVQRTFRAPDGNQVVKLDLDTGLAWPSVTELVRNTEV